MQYLSELLGEGSARKKPKAPVSFDSTRSKPSPSQPLSSTPRSDAKPDELPQKRKAERDLNDTNGKQAKTTEPYRGTAGLNAARGSSSASKPSTKPSAAAPPKNGSAARPSNAQANPTPAVPPPAAAPNQKLSRYQQLLARGAALQANSKPVGAITHKPVEKLSKRARLAQEAEAKNGKKPDKRTDDRRSKSSTPDAASASRKVERKDYGYTGTMRPKPAESSYKGTMGMRQTGSKDGSRRWDAERGRDAGYSSRDRYAGYTSYDESDVEESDLSDMEAGAFDLEQEEFRSLRAARKEDEEALREEEAHRRAKLERRRKLEELSSKRLK